MLAERQMQLPANDDRWVRLYSRKLEQELVSAFEKLRNAGIEPLAIKGWAAARNYPPNKLRFYTDIDLAVSHDDFERARDVLAAQPAVAVDLHQELRHFDPRPWDAIFSASVEAGLDGYPVRIPSPEDHLRILAIHWMTDGGQDRDRLLDIRFAIEKRPEGFDWEKCLDAAGEPRRGWIVAAVGLASRYAGLAIDDLPFAEEARRLPDWLVRTVEKEWKLGVPLRSLHTCLTDPVELFRQLKKRLPPNGLQATIESGGDIYTGSRLRFQLASIRRRLVPSVRGLRDMVRRGRSVDE